MIYTNKIDGKRFIQTNKGLFDKLKEDDYDFLVKAKYGDKVDAQALYNQRLKNAFLIFIVMFFVIMSKISFINILFVFVVTFFIFKSGYSNLKTYYKNNKPGT